VKNFKNLGKEAAFNECSDHYPQKDRHDCKRRVVRTYLVDADGEGGGEVFGFRELHGPCLFGPGRSASREGILGQTRIRESAVAAGTARSLTGRPTVLGAKW